MTSAFSDLLRTPPFCRIFILAELAEIGVRRVSIGAGLYRIAMAAAGDAASEMKDGGFTFVNDMIRIRDLRGLFGEL